MARAKQEKTAPPPPAPAISLAEEEARRVLALSAPEADEIQVDGISFDLDEPKFPRIIKDRALTSGGYPYDERMDRDAYDDALHLLQMELVKFQRCVLETRRRVLLLFEGRDAAGKGGAIKTIRQHLNPRWVREVALSKPSDVEAGQWYFQRYTAHLPSAGEIMLFDRSWYNRAGVERVMGFATPEQVESFLDQVPRYEQLLADDGIILIKFWLEIGREMQLKRFHDRRHDALKVWKLSPIDLKALTRWDDYTVARDAMFERTHSPEDPWIVVRANDKRRARVNVIRHVLTQLDYEGKSAAAIGEIDRTILMTADERQRLDRT